MRLASRFASALSVGAAWLLIAACAAPRAVPSQPARAIDPDRPYLHAHPGLTFRLPARLELVNRNGSPRVAHDSLYARFRERIAPLVVAWARDERLAINPAFVAALLAKESGYEQYATSYSPANGYPQLTQIADLDLRAMIEAPAWRWMRAEVLGWPRHPMVHDARATKARTDSLVAAGVLGPRNEYLFDPPRATRAAVFWLRLLREVWTSDAWPGRYGSFARERLGGGGPISESQLLDLVTVSYNQGYPYVHALVARHGVDWTRHLNEEADDYLERIRVYTVLFQR